jgi:DNA polymerase-3 subunit gamma/tau
VVSVQRKYTGKKRSGISISAMQNEKTEKQDAEAIEDLTNKPRTDFTINELMSKWNAFSYQLKVKGRQGLYVTLTKRKPALKENFILEFTIDNEIQKIELEEERSNLLSFIRIELNNYGIQLKVLLSQEDNSVKHLSSKDKFMKMAEKNPALHVLREKLNLDIEY